MKKIAVFFKQPGVKDYPFNKSEYWNSYLELNTEIEKIGAEFYIVRDNTTYLGNGKFSKSWKFKNGDLVETGEIIVDKIYDKGDFQADNTVSVLNNEFVNEICTDKWKTYELFKEFCPETILIRNENEFENALKKIKSSKKVIKPLDDEKGNGVFIGKSEYLKNCPHEFPLLVQDFLDTSGGVPGISEEGLHDFRVAILNGEFLFSFLRTPPKGELMANIAQGGACQIIEKSDIPKSVQKILSKIETIFGAYGDYFFGLDVGFVDGIPKIIELNSRVGLQENARHPIFRNVKVELAKALVK